MAQNNVRCKSLSESVGIWCFTYCSKLLISFTVPTLIQQLYKLPSILL